MTETKVTGRARAADVIERYGKCLELVPTDPSFHDVSVGLYVKDGACTVWTFSRKPGVRERVQQIRDQLVALGGLTPIEETTDQVSSPCGHLHIRPVRFLMAQAVGKAKEYAQPGGDMSIKDSKTDLIISLSGSKRDGRYVYEVAAQGEAANPALRLRMIVAGFLRYGEMEKSGDAEVTFQCGQRHDQLMRLLLPYSRNISAVEGMMEAEALRGQMTTNTLGFTPSS